MRVLLVGRTPSVIDNVIEKLDTPGVDFSAASTLEQAQDVLTESPMDHVILGGGLDIETRLQIVRYVFATSSSTTVHMNSAAGPGSYLPFVRSVLHGLAEG